MIVVFAKTCMYSVRIGGENRGTLYDFGTVALCKARSGGGFLPFWLPNLIYRGIPKDTKKPTNSQSFKYELVG